MKDLQDLFLLEECSAVLFYQQMEINVVAELLLVSSYQLVGVLEHLHNQISTVAEHNTCNMTNQYIYNERNDFKLGNSRTIINVIKMKL